MTPKLEQGSPDSPSVSTSDDKTNPSGVAMEDAASKQPGDSSENNDGHSFPTTTMATEDDDLPPLYNYDEHSEHRSHASSNNSRRSGDSIDEDDSSSSENASISSRSSSDLENNSHPKGTGGHPQVISQQPQPQGILKKTSDGNGVDTKNPVATGSILKPSRRRSEAANHHHHHHRNNDDDEDSFSDQSDSSSDAASFDPDAESSEDEQDDYKDSDVEDDDSSEDHSIASLDDEEKSLEVSVASDKSQGNEKNAINLVGASAILDSLSDIEEHTETGSTNHDDSIIITYETKLAGLSDEEEENAAKQQQPDTRRRPPPRTKSGAGMPSGRGMRRAPPGRTRSGILLPPGANETQKEAALQRNMVARSQSQQMLEAMRAAAQNAAGGDTGGRRAPARSVSDVGAFQRRAPARTKSGALEGGSFERRAPSRTKSGAGPGSFERRAPPRTKSGDGLGARRARQRAVAEEGEGDLSPEKEEKLIRNMVARTQSQQMLEAMRASAQKSAGTDAAGSNPGSTGVERRAPPRTKSGDMIRRAPPRSKSGTLGTAPPPRPGGRRQDVLEKETEG